MKAHERLLADAARAHAALRAASLRREGRGRRADGLRTDESWPTVVTRLMGRVITVRHVADGQRHLRRGVPFQGWARPWTRVRDPADAAPRRGCRRLDEVATLTSGDLTVRVAKGDAWSVDFVAHEVAW